MNDNVLVLMYRPSLDSTLTATAPAPVAIQDGITHANDVPAAVSGAEYVGVPATRVVNANRHDQVSVGACTFTSDNGYTYTINVWPPTVLVANGAMDTNEISAVISNPVTGDGSARSCAINVIVTLSPAENTPIGVVHVTVAVSITDAVVVTTTPPLLSNEHTSGDMDSVLPVVSVIVAPPLTAPYMGVIDVSVISTTVIYTDEAGHLVGGTLDTVSISLVTYTSYTVASMAGVGHSSDVPPALIFAAVTHVDDDDVLSKMQRAPVKNATPVKVIVAPPIVGENCG